MRKSRPRSRMQLRSVINERKLMGWLSQEVESEIQELQRLYQVHDHEFVTNPDAPLPPELFHYTSFEGLKGILENRCLWFTHYHYLNDSTEVIYGRQMVEKIVQERIEPFNEMTRLLLHGLLDNHPVIYDNFAIYLASLSEDGDLLSQWRAYSDQGKGCAIGFKPRLDTKGKKPTIPSPQQLGVGLTQVVYDPIHQCRMITEFVDSLYRTFDRNVKLASLFRSNPKKLVPFFQNCSGPLMAMGLYLLYQNTYRIKNPYFREEREWRLVYLLDEKSVGDSNQPEVKSRVKGESIIPYVEYPINPLDKDVLGFDISRIRCGPTFHPDLMPSKIEALLKQTGFDGVPLERSQIPLRV